MSTVEDVLSGAAQWCVIHAEAEAFLRTLPDACVDGSVCDPPYGIGTRDPLISEILDYFTGQATLDTGGDFMSEKWSLPPVSLWREVFRVLKPGAWIAVFGGTQTDDLLSIGLRAAGFERQDAIDIYGTGRLAWVNSQGMAKGLNISKAIDEAAGLEREVIGVGNTDCPYLSRGEKCQGHNDLDRLGETVHQAATAPASTEAAHWDGHSTSVAPKHEPVLLFRKPFAQVTSEQLRAATGWDHWHSIRDLRRPEARAEAAARFGCDVPEKARVVTKRALHSSVTSRVELQAGNGWAVLAVRDEGPYREWSTRTVAANVLAHGCGGVNIGATRIAHNDPVQTTVRTVGKFSGIAYAKDAYSINMDGGTMASANPLGRMPNNVCLIHCDECREVGTRAVRGQNPIYAGTGKGDTGMLSTGPRPSGAGIGYGSPDGTETVPAWECLAGCPACLATTVAPAGGAAPACECGAAMTWICTVADLDASAGLLVSSGGTIKAHHAAMGYGGGNGSERTAIKDSGGASRFFHTFKPDASPVVYAGKSPSKERHAGGKNPHVCVKPQRALRHFWKLIMPPGGVGLDCFSGSGSGAAAGVAEGFRVVAVEQDAEHVETSLRRIPALLAMAGVESAGGGPRPVAPVQAAKKKAKPADGQRDLFALFAEHAAKAEREAKGAA